MSEEARSSPFWRFSLRFYREPKVADACIALQEDAGIDVNLLLFLLWHATHAHTLTPDEVASLERRIGAWREMTVVPLRNVRRALKSPPALVESNTAELFRTKIKSVELEAERLQQEAMYALARDKLLGRKIASTNEAARANVAAYAAAIAKPFSNIAVETLLAAFARLEPKPEE